MISQFVCVWEMFFPACILFFIFIFDVSTVYEKIVVLIKKHYRFVPYCLVYYELIILVNQCRKCFFNFMNFVIKGHFLCGCK